MSTSYRGKNQALRTAVTLFAVALLSACASAPPAPTPEARSQLAPGGKLRVGLLVTNPAFVSKDGAPNEMQGVGVELARELANQLNVAFEPVRYKTSSSLLDGSKRNEWDVAPMGYSPERTADMDFTTLYAVGESKYLVPTASSIRGVANVDKPAASSRWRIRSAQDTYLTGNLKRAEVVRPTNGALRSAGAHEVGQGPRLFHRRGGQDRRVARKAAGIPLGRRRLKVSGTALAVAKGRPAGTAYTKDFVVVRQGERLRTSSRSSTTDCAAATVAPAGASY